MGTKLKLFSQNTLTKLFLKILFYINLLRIGSAIVIKTNNGPVAGFETNIGLVTIHTFKNIPYAKQPIGNLRFELPEDSESWLKVDDSHENEAIACPQPSSKREGEDSVVGREDCLLLDVYLRKNSETRDLLPVLIYFHAGQFSSGSKNEYNPGFLLSLHDIIIVIPNYRLGILGFLSGGDWENPTNLGLWDQRKSMQWVHENIENFGGDKNRVTIAGHDAGGASVGFHILSPMSHRFFSAAISGSGTVLDPWVMLRNSTPTIAVVAEKVGCQLNASSIMDCLKMSGINKILHTQTALKKVRFLPSVDGHLKHSIIPEAPQIMYQLGYQKNVPYLAGVTKNEASIEIDQHFSEALKHKHLDSITSHLLEPFLRGSPDLHEIAKAAKYHYLRGAQIPSFESIEPQMEMLLSDFLYNSPLHMTLSFHSVRAESTFMYVFTYYDRQSRLGVTHMKDAFYIFNKTLEKPATDFTEEMSHVKHVLCDVWGNFIKSHKPGDPEIWKKFRENHHPNYAEISTTLSPRINYRQEAMDFWNSLIPDLIYYHRLSPERPTNVPFDDPSYTAWGLAGLAIILMVLCVAMAGTVTVARRRYTHSSILPISSTRENVQYSRVG